MSLPPTDRDRDARDGTVGALCAASGAAISATPDKVGPSVQLERALLWHVPGACPVRCWGGSLLGQALVLWAAVALVLPPWHEGKPVAAPSRGAVALFTAPSLPAPSPKRTVAMTPGSLSPAPPESASGFPRPKPNLSAMELRFELDVQGRLPETLRQQHGLLALLDKEDPSIARYLFEAPQWKSLEAGVDVSSMLCLWMDPPEAWSVLREIARRDGIRLDRYRAAALFDIGYRKCLQDAIASAPGGVPPGVSAQIRGARLAFAADRPCGVAVLEVSYGERPARVAN
jgi:hypothetical protein